MNGYKVSVEDAMSVVDKLSVLDTKAATTAGDLATAMSKTASSASLAGASMDELLAYMATIQEVTQAQPEEIGNAMRMLFARIQQVKVGTLVDPETGEDVSKAEAALKQYGVTLRDSTNTFKDFGTIMDEVAAIWGNLTNAEQNELAEALAGNRQREKLTVLLDNYSRALELQEESMNSAGSATDKFNTYQESTAAKMSELSNQFQIFATNTIDGAFVKAIITATTNLMKFFNETNTLIPAIGLLAAALFRVQLGKFFSGIGNSIQQIVTFRDVMNSLSSAKVMPNYDAISASLAGLTEKQQVAIVTSKSLTAEQANQIITNSSLSASEKELLQAKVQSTQASASETAATVSAATAKTVAELAARGLTNAEIAQQLASKGVEAAEIAKALAMNGASAAQVKAALSAAGFTTAQIAAATGTSTFTTAIMANIKAMITWMATNPVGWIMALVTVVPLLTSAFDALIVTYDEQIKKLDELKQEYKATQDDIAQVTSQFKDNENTINEIKSQGKLDVVDQNTVTQLEAENAALKVQLATLREIEAQQKKDVSNKALDTYNTQVNVDTVSTGDTSANVKGKQTDLIRKQYENMIEQSKKFQETGEDKYLQNLNNEYGRMSDAVAILLPVMQELDTTTVEGKAAYDDITDALQTFYKAAVLSPDMNTFEEIFDAKVTEEQRQELIALAQQGQLTANSFKENFPELSTMFEAIGLNVDDVIEKLGTMEGMEGPVDYFDSLKESVDSSTGLLAKALDEQNRNGKITAQTYNDLIAKGEDYAALIKIVDGETVLMTTDAQAYARSLIDTSIATATQRGATEEQIQSMKNLYDQVLGTTGAFDAFIHALDSIDQSQQTFEKVTTAVETLKDGLEEGMTETDQFHAGLALLFGETPPNDINKSLKELSKLFMSGKNEASDMLDVIRKYSTNGMIDFGKLQKGLGLSDEALGSVIDKLEDMGLLFSTTPGLDNIANGLGLASDKAVNLESRLKGVYKEFEKNGDLTAANKGMEGLIKQFGLTGEAANILRDNWNYMLKGLDQDTIGAFQGMDSKSRDAIRKLAGNQINEYKTALKESQFNIGDADTENVFSPMFKMQNPEELRRQLQEGFNSAESIITSEATKVPKVIESAFDFTGIKENYAKELEKIGGYTTAEIDRISNDLALDQIEIQVDTIIDTVVSGIDVDSSGKSKIKNAIMDSYDSENMTFDIDTALNTVIDSINVENPEGVKKAIQDSVNEETGEIDLNKLQANLKSIGLDDVYGKIQPIVGALQTLNTTSQAQIIQQEKDLRSELEKAQTDATNATNALRNIDTVKTATVRGEISSLRSQIDTAQGRAISLEATLGRIGRMTVRPTVSVPSTTGPDSATGAIRHPGGDSLVGELGPEARISANGNLTIVGQSGPEIVNLKKGDTILPADVTKRILSGEIPMYATGVIGKGTGPSSSKKKKKVTSKKSSSSKSSSKKSSSSSSKDKWEGIDDLFDDLRHRFAMEYIDEATFYKKLMELNNKYYKGKKDKIDEYRSILEEVYDYERRRVLDNIDLRIDNLEGQRDMLTEGSADWKKITNQISNEQKKKQTEINNLLKKYRKAGFKEDSEVIQDLKKEWFEVEKWKREEQKKTRELQIDNMETTIDAVIRVIDKEIEALEKQRDALSDEEVKGSYGYRIKALNDQIKLMKDQNDEINKQIELEKAQMELERLRRQRTLLVYREGVGFVYEADVKALQEQEKAVQDLEFEIEIDKLEKQVEELEAALEKEEKAIDKQIKKWEDYKEQWSSIVDDYKDSQDKLIADQMLGANWEKKILQQRLDVVKNFRKAYNKEQEALKKLNETAIKLEGQTDLNSMRAAMEKVKNAIKTTTKKYAIGTTNASKGLANVDENGKELLIRNPQRGRYTYLEYGDGVLKPELTKTLINLAQNPNKFVEGAISSVKLPTIKENDSSLSMSMGDIVIQNPVGSAESLADQLINKFPNTMDRHFHKRR